MKSCRFCGEEIREAAKKCKHCNQWLDTTANVSLEDVNRTMGNLPHTNLSAPPGQLMTGLKPQPVSSWTTGLAVFVVFLVIGIGMYWWAVPAEIRGGGSSVSLSQADYDLGFEQGVADGQRAYQVPARKWSDEEIDGIVDDLYRRDDVRQYASEKGFRFRDGYFDGLKKGYKKANDEYWASREKSSVREPERRASVTQGLSGGHSNGYGAAITKIYGMSHDEVMRAKTNIDGFVERETERLEGVGTDYRDGYAAGLKDALKERLRR